MKRSLELLEQILVIAEAQEKEMNEANIKLHKASRTVGESALLFHLKCLQELMAIEIAEGVSVPVPPTTITLPGDKTYTVSYGG